MDPGHVVALADQSAGRDAGLSVAIDLRPHLHQNPCVQSASYHTAFHDVVTGDNTVMVEGETLQGYQAGPGWSPVTGWGTPVASVLIPLLAG